MQEKDLIMEISNLLVENKIPYSQWCRISEFIYSRYYKEIKKSTLKDTPKI